MAMEQKIAEILERTVRMESRMVQLGDYVGANLRAKQRIEIRDASRSPYVVIDSLDVSVSRILTELEQHGVPAANVPVIHGGVTAFILRPTT